jgi:hypothetical protein
LYDKFRLGHTTLLVEPPGAPEACRQADEGVV